MDTITYHSNQARQNWRDVMDTAAAVKDVVVTHYGRPVAALIPYAGYVDLQEELEDLRLACEAAAVYQAYQDGRLDTRPWEEIKAELESRHDG